MVPSPTAGTTVLHRSIPRIVIGQWGRVYIGGGPLVWVLGDGHEAMRMGAHNILDYFHATKANVRPWMPDLLGKRR